MAFKWFKTFIRFSLCLYFTAGGSEAVTQSSGMRCRSSHWKCSIITGVLKLSQN